MIIRSCSSFLAFLFFLCQIYGQSPDLNRLDNYLKQVTKDWGIPGMTVGIVKDGELIFAKGYGIKEVGKNDAPDQNTLYAIASNSKAFTSAVIALLVQEGKLNWDDKVQKHLPYFELYDPYISSLVTVKDLLCHRVGLGTFSGDIIWYNAHLSSEELIKRFKYVPKAYEFRDGYGYSNLMFITAGELIKKLSGKSWFENVNERILMPLGMNRTTIYIDSLAGLGNIATPHRLDNGINIPFRWTPWEEIAATGGLISSVQDLSKWLIFNLNNGIWKQDTILSPTSRNILWTPANNFIINHVKKSETNQLFSGYALGWGIRDYRGHLRLSHTGGYDGMITAINLLPDQKLGVIVLTNGMKSPIGAVSLYAMDFMLGVEEKDWSTELLENANRNIAEDTRIADRKAKRVLKTNTSLPTKEYAGVFRSDIYGDIVVASVGDSLKLSFEHTPLLDAKLSHWHYDVFEIKWDHPHAWFSFGTVKFKLDNNNKVIGIEFDVPNDDFFFEELKPYKINK